jgi:hypothetical protein
VLPNVAPPDITSVVPVTVAEDEIPATVRVPALAVIDPARKRDLLAVISSVTASVLPSIAAPVTASVVASVAAPDIKSVVPVTTAEDEIPATVSVPALAVMDPEEIMPA